MARGSSFGRGCEKKTAIPAELRIWLAYLAFSLAGDTFLMFEGYFLAGLASFLLAHLCYIALFKDGVPWLPSRRTLVVVLALGAATYAFLFGHLPGALRVRCGRWRPPAGGSEAAGVCHRR